MLDKKDFSNEYLDKYINITKSNKNNIPVFILGVEGDFSEDKKANWKLFADLVGVDKN